MILDEIMEERDRDENMQIEQDIQLEKQLEAQLQEEDNGLVIEEMDDTALNKLPGIRRYDGSPQPLRAVTEEGEEHNGMSD